MASTVIMFPGMGAQYTGMLRRFIAANPEKETLINTIIDERAILGFCTRYGIAPTDVMDDLRVQLAIHALNVAWWDKVQVKYSSPIFCGHSLGLYAALVAAGCLEVETSRNLIIEIFLISWLRFSDNPKKTAVVTTFKPMDVSSLNDLGIEAIAFNNHAQTLVYGDEDNIQKWVQGNSDAILSIKWMENRVPFHSDEMANTCEDIDFDLIRDVPLQPISDPAKRLFSHIETREIHTVEDMRWHLAYQLKLPVQWTNMILALKDMEPSEFVEVGPGKILSQMVRWIDKRIKTNAIDSLREK